MRIIKGRLAFALIATAWCVGPDVLAQVSPLTDFKPIETYRKRISCAENNCRITMEQLLALRIAMQLYKEDMPGVGRTSFQVGMKGGSIVVTVFPEVGVKVPEFDVPGGVTAVTYIFDSSGSHLMKKNYNR